MFKAIGFGIAFGAGFQALRNYPPSGPMTQDSLWVILTVAVVLAYLGGRWHGRGNVSAHATATATATATSDAVASNHVQVAVIVPGQGAGQHRAGTLIPTDAAPWFTGQDRPEITANDLDGMDLSDFSSDHARDYEHESVTD